MSKLLFFSKSNFSYALYVFNIIFNHMKTWKVPCLSKQWFAIFIVTQLVSVNVKSVECKPGQAEFIDCSVRNLQVSCTIHLFVYLDFTLKN